MGLCCASLKKVAHRDHKKGPQKANRVPASTSSKHQRSRLTTPGEKEHGRAQKESEQKEQKQGPQQLYEGPNSKLSSDRTGSEPRWKILPLPQSAESPERDATRPSATQVPAKDLPVDSGHVLRQTIKAVEEQAEMERGCSVMEPEYSPAESLNNSTEKNCIDEDVYHSRVALLMSEKPLKRANSGDSDSQDENTNNASINRNEVTPSDEKAYADVTAHVENESNSQKPLWAQDTSVWSAVDHDALALDSEAILPHSSAVVTGIAPPEADVEEPMPAPTQKDEVRVKDAEDHSVKEKEGEGHEEGASDGGALVSIVSRVAAQLPSSKTNNEKENLNSIGDDEENKNIDTLKAFDAKLSSTGSRENFSVFDVHFADTESGGRKDITPQSESPPLPFISSPITPPRRHLAEKEEEAVNKTEDTSLCVSAKAQLITWESDNETAPIVTGDTKTDQDTSGNEGGKNEPKKEDAEETRRPDESREDEYKEGVDTRGSGEEITQRGFAAAAAAAVHRDPTVIDKFNASAKRAEMEASSGTNRTFLYEGEKKIEKQQERTVIPKAPQSQEVDSEIATVKESTVEGGQAPVLFSPPPPLVANNTLYDNIEDIFQGYPKKSDH